MSEGFQRAGGVTIPGPEQHRGTRRATDPEPMAQVGSLAFVRITRPIMVGDRHCAAGEVVRVSPRPAGRVEIMPPIPLLLEDRAKWFVENKYAEPHPGPATVQLGGSKDLEKSLKTMADQIEAAIDPAPRAADRAVTPRQGRGAI